MLPQSSSRWRVAAPQPGGAARERRSSMTRPLVTHRPPCYTRGGLLRLLAGRTALSLPRLRSPGPRGAEEFEREPVRRILAHLGLPTETTPPARARDPTDDLADIEPAGQLDPGLAEGDGARRRGARARKARGGRGAPWTGSTWSAFQRDGNWLGVRWALC